MKAIILGLTVAGASLLALHAADVDVSKLPPASTKKDVTFEKDIKPIFEKSCFKCHGAEKQKGKLRVDGLEAIKKHENHAALLGEGKSEKSTMVHSVAGLIEDGLMPPEGKGDPLTKDQIGLLRAWIDQGAR